LLTHEGNIDVKFKVHLKWRTKLAPVELLVELLMEQLYDDNEDESSPGAKNSTGFQT
jgi:hypothetical protein